ncbi:hypothetical protein HMPREF9418_2122 [Neisseria macacae ATCC 33926]|uniref:Uncharacterized protein n=1 Tax=Neisseria macacae ATCC 33926 TaxID=997348 RepID=A0AA36UHU3_9NEIS|nr:hypothetical protein HMPREF9418_2122 [Neisseria macacae ATCC 33926]
MYVWILGKLGGFLLSSLSVQRFSADGHCLIKFALICAKKVV